MALEDELEVEPDVLVDDASVLFPLVEPDVVDDVSVLSPLVEPDVAVDDVSVLFAVDESVLAGCDAESMEVVFEAEEAVSVLVELDAESVAVPVDVLFAPDVLVESVAPVPLVVDEVSDGVVVDEELEELELELEAVDEDDAELEELELLDDSMARE